MNFFRHSGYIWRTAIADVRHRYAGAGAGALWNLLDPLSRIAIYSVVFSQIMSRELRDEAPYAIFLCSALLPWLAFGECISRGTRALISNAQYLRKMPIPESVFVAQVVVAAAIGLVISYALLAIVATIIGFTPTWHWLLLPLPFAMLLLLGFGCALITASIFPFIRDVGEIVNVLLMVGFWSYPIIYVRDILPEGLQGVLPFNPVYPALEATRQLVIQHKMPDPWLWAAGLGWGLAATLLGLAVMRGVRAEIRDVI
ncbi:MAG: ABC transporter permease [Planctomycetota bacterium]